ncbi:PHP domain-containing protein [Methanoculleus sp. FWC-SCC1]|uniref:PHP domain-containing protein n=1 Tax=Methanoculleus frigidifontis TaxID=2584085 RepID=A0ABT8MBY6_9EURY|nr:PHP domain-containing protein [Methanoculleus sp. FWC-SCC1]MDN7025424.1 PHP domain-containing protein [Methanoculleus sp. FWC-SCC1]
MDLHIHSKYSYDSFASPQRILKTADKRNIRVLSITDHNTMAAYASARSEIQRASRRYEICVVPGMEIKTDWGDVIGLFLETEIAPQPFYEVVDRIRDQDGLVVLPHPYRRRCDPATLVPSVDLVEVINAKSRQEENTRAEALCAATGKRPVTGSDAHACWEIGRVVTQIDIDGNDPEEVRRALLSADRRCTGRCSNHLLANGYSLCAARFKQLVHI